MPRPSRSDWFDHANHTWWRVQIMKLLIVQFCPVSCQFIPLGSKYDSPADNREASNEAAELTEWSHQSALHNYGQTERQTHCCVKNEKQQQQQLLNFVRLSIDRSLECATEDNLAEWFMSCCWMGSLSDINLQGVVFRSRAQRNSSISTPNVCVHVFIWPALIACLAVRWDNSWQPRASQGWLWTFLGIWSSIFNLRHKHHWRIFIIPGKMYSIIDLLNLSQQKQKIRREIQKSAISNDMMQFKTHTFTTFLLKICLGIILSCLPSGFPTKMLQASLVPPIRVTGLVHLT
jgi:hypothetical protein